MDTHLHATRPGQPAAGASRRLVQDFVTAPLPAEALLGRLDGDPSPVPTIVEAAAEWPHGTGSEAHPSAHSQVQVRQSRPRSDGWSVELGWPGGSFGLPAFDGELVVHPLDPGRTWIGLEGVVSLVVAANWSDRELREAQAQLRGLLTNLAEVLASVTGPGQKTGGAPVGA